jgi:hypothetical protein
MVDAVAAMIEGDILVDLEAPALNHASNTTSAASAALVVLSDSCSVPGSTPRYQPCPAVFRIG